MGIYLGLVGFLFLTTLIERSRIDNFAKQEKNILKLNTFAMFLVFALRKETVGIDMSGYKQMYELVGNLSWSDFNFVYFEKGYILLTKVFAKLGCSFQLFLIVIYAFISLSLYYFIKRYSKDVMLSLLIYICYQFFIFNLSGLRQAIATAICLVAFSFLEDRKIRSTIVCILLILLAFFVHRSAAIFILVPFAVRIKITPVKLGGYLCACIAALVLRSNVSAFLNSNFSSYETASEISIGGNFILILGVAIFSYFTICHTSYTKRYISVENDSTCSMEANKKHLFDIDYSSTILMFIAVLLYLLLTGSTMLRAVMYVSIFIIILLPNIIKRYTNKGGHLIKYVIIILMLAIFYFKELSINQFNILPYYFFWQ